MCIKSISDNALSSLTLLPVLAMLGLVGFATPAVADSLETNRQSRTRDLVQDEHARSKLPISRERYMFSVTLHKPEQIQSLLTRADELSKTMRTKGNGSRIALILHGPEIRFFENRNYQYNKELVDRASRLDGDQVIEIKVCKTKMDELGVDEKELPSFVEIIPYAPDEEKRLLKKGYVYF